RLRSEFALPDDGERWRPAKRRGIPPPRRFVLGLSASPPGKASPHQAGQPIAKLLGVQRTIAFEHARLIKEKMRHVLLELPARVAQPGNREDDIVPRIDLEDWL